MLLLENENKGNFVDRVVLKNVLVSWWDYFFSLIDTNDFESMVEVGNWDLLNLENIVAIKDGLKIFSCQKDGLELVQTIVMGVLFVELLPLDWVEHFQDNLFGVVRLFVQNISQKFL